MPVALIWDGARVIDERAQHLVETLISGKWIYQDAIDPPGPRTSEDAARGDAPVNVAAD